MFSEAEEATGTYIQLRLLKMFCCVQFLPDSSQVSPVVTPVAPSLSDHQNAPKEEQSTISDEILGDIADQTIQDLDFVLPHLDLSASDINCIKREFKDDPRQQKSVHFFAML